VNRRFLLASGALAAAVALSSCAGFSNNNEAARVGSNALAVDDIGTLVGNEDAVQDGAVVRSGLTKWVRVELLEQATNTSDPAVANAANLDARLANGLTALASETPDAGRDLYQSGPELSGNVCLGAIPVDTEESAQAVLADLQGGMSWADAAAKYSVDEGLAGNGGIVINGDGNECIATADVNPDLVGPVIAAGVGQPVIVDLGSVRAVLVIRPYDDLSDAAKLVLARSAMNLVRLPELLAEADVYIDPRYGVWNPATAEVDPLRA
jgi:hypothetical protein